MTRNHYKNFFLGLLFIFMNISCFGQQNFLMLQKRNKNKNAYYKPGDIISFRVKGDRSKISGEILEFKDSLIVVNGLKVTVNEIDRLYIDEKTKWWLRFKLSQLLPMA